MVAAVNRAAIEANIASTLAAIPGVENVYTTFARPTNIEELLAKYQTGDEQWLQFWKIARVSSDPHTAESHHGQVDIRTHVHYYFTWMIELFVGYKDGLSEPYFQTLIDTVLNYTAEQRTYGAWNSLQPLQHLTTMQEFRHNQFGHVATFMLTLIDDQSGLAPH